jgi:sugar phosphate isomerase/epimerase
MPEPGRVAGVGLSVGPAAERMADLGPALDRFERLGLDSVEIFLPALGVVAGARVRPSALAALRSACAGRPFALTLHGALGSSFGEPEHNPLQMDVCRASLDVAAEIGAGVLVHHSAVVRDAGPDTPARTLAAEAAALATIAPHATGAGVVLAVETMAARPGEWTAAPSEIARTLAAVDSPWIAATIDFSHAFLATRARGLDYLAEIAALAPYARHLHIHDSFGLSAAFRPWSRGDAVMFGFGDLHLPPGAGAIPWDALAALPFGGPAVANLELDPRWEDEWPAAIAFTRRWAAACAAPARRGRGGSAAARRAR